ncbi:DUF6338 family protein [Nocardia vinacea]|uniref:DUF6338 family protein n=1 Tax=Nocardia vinacea TaxID=96468 RepID=UPI002E0D1447|nr:DUF6338 family protein [Nocardia vinacea]
MAQAPSAAQQIVLLVLFVLPGISYQFIRERLRGQVPGEKDLGERVLRAIAASIILNSIYLIIAGPEIVNLIVPTHGAWFTTVSTHPRQITTVGLALLVAIPAAAAWLVSAVERRRSPSRFHPVPTAWDSAFRTRSACFVRARLKSGDWVGGWYGNNSHASAYPNPADLFLEAAREMTDDGRFGPRVQQSAGLYLRMDDVEILEFVHTTPTIENPQSACPNEQEQTHGE